MDQSNNESKGDMITHSDLQEIFTSCVAYQLFDCSMGESSRESYLKECIPNAKYFDLSDFKDKEGKYPNKFPDKDIVTRKMRQHGFNVKDLIILYHQSGEKGAFRVHYILKSYGYPNVVYLNGGISEWKRCQHDTESGVIYEDSMFTPDKIELNEDHLIDIKEVIEKIDDENSIIIDSRSAAQYDGSQSVQKQCGAKSDGHIKGAINVPGSSFFDEDGLMMEGSVIK